MRILLGMSGGVDSTYAAIKLINEGHAVEGAVLLMHSYTEIDEAKVAAESVGIKLNVIDCREMFENRVIRNFIDEYTSGRTPNPCIVCNREVKFFCLYQYAMENGFDRIATGHYAKIVTRDVDGQLRYAVSRALDTRKDQTYMLYRLPQEILSKTMFPLADDEKIEVKLKAQELGLSVADRAESQEICFVPSGDYADFIEDRVGASKHGSFVDCNGKILGEHKGIIRYTVGQRKGLGIAMGERLFVTKINADDNTVTLSRDDSYSDSVTVFGMVFSGIAEMSKGEKRSFFVKLRYLAKPIECELEYMGDANARIKLFEPQRAVTPGQSAVFYDKDTVVAGGFILL